MQQVWNRKQDREDYRSASIQALMAEMNRDHEKRSEPFTALDFMSLREPGPGHTGKTAKKKQPTPKDKKQANQQAISMLRGLTAGLKQ